MILINDFSRPVFWRTFSSSDTVYVFGLLDGWVAPGGTAQYDHPSGQFQMEFKSGAPGHPFLRRAGETFRNDDELVVTPEGQVMRLEQTVRVERDPGERREIIGNVSNFFDKLAFDGDSTDEITTVISNVVTISGSVSTRTTSSSGSETSTGAGAEVTGKGTFKGIDVGVKFNGSVSSKVSQSTTRELATSHGISGIQTTTLNRKMSVLLRGRTLTAIHWVWERFYVSGRTHAGGQVFPWDVATRVEASYRIEQYNSIAAMPPDVFEAYREKYPASGLVLLRPGTPFLVDGNGWVGVLRVGQVPNNGALQGTLYGQPILGAWTPADGNVSFTRTIHASYLQHWRARMRSDTDVQGSFYEEVNGQRQPTLYSWRMAARLRVNGNNYVGALEVDDMAADGSFTGRLYDDNVVGRWDQAAGQIQFTRAPGHPNYSQEWKGSRVGDLTFAGTFQERVGGNLDPVEYGWTAQP